MKTIENEIIELAPWITRINYRGNELGGSYDAGNDSRVTRFIEKLKDLGGGKEGDKILECGCLEGGHSVKIASEFPNASIVSTDVREENLVKAKVHAKLAGARNINFKLADLETESELFLADFSFIFCVGLLYHLRNPSSFLSRCAKSAPKIWISTVISSERDAELVKENDKYRGRIYVEPTDHPLSAIREHSFFPNLGSLCNMLWDAGYNKIELLEQTMTPNGNGPAILLYACY